MKASKYPADANIKFDCPRLENVKKYAELDKHSKDLLIYLPNYFIKEQYVHTLIISKNIKMGGPDLAERRFLSVVLHKI